MADDSAGMVDRVRHLLFGTVDPRLRAIWRVLLATPVLWLLTGDVLTANLVVLSGISPGGNQLGSGLGISLLHGGFLVLALTLWARYLDRQPLSDYGVSASPEWARDLVVGMVAIGIATGVWHAVGVVLGWTAVRVSVSPTGWSFLIGFLLFLLALGIHATIQQVVFFRVIPKIAAEGLHHRGLNPPRAVVAGVLVALPFFLSIHTLAPPLRIVDLLVAGLVYGLLFAQTGDLALGIGVHTGVFVVSGVVFAPASGAGLGPSVFQVVQSPPGVLNVIAQYGFPNLVGAYLLLLGWLYWRRGEADIRRDIARWTRA